MNKALPRFRRGFTLIELLTVIAIIGILAAILIPTVGRVREHAKRAKCMSNVRQLNLGLISYANQNKAQTFPSNAGAGQWAWDVQHTVIRDIVNQAGREVLYCPSSSMLVSSTMKELYEYGGSDNSFAVTSYVLLVTGTKQMPATYLNDKIKAEYSAPAGLGTTLVPPSRRALVVDAVISAGDNFVTVAGGLTDNVSNHMAGTNPAGAHTGFVDGHVTWRTFRKGTLATAADPTVFTMKSTSNTPNFWF